MILVDHQIKDYVEKGLLGIENFSEQCVQPASYDMRIGEEVYLSTKRDVLKLSGNGGHFTIDPSAVANITTYECLKLPNNIAGRPGIKSGLARRGLFTSIGIQADPGFDGRLFISVFNVTPLPVTLGYLDTFLSIEFNQLKNIPENPYNGPHQGKTNMSTEDIQPLLAYDGLNLAQIHKGFTELNKNVGIVATFGERLDRFAENYEKQMEKVMKHNTQLVKEIKTLVQHIASSKDEPVVLLRDVDREQASKEIEELFKGCKTLYYSDIAQQLRLDLELVVDICNELEEKGIIGMLEQ